MTIKIGSLFSGIGGFELGLERAIPNSETVWQCEENKFCQKILAKHWPNAIIYDDVRTINKEVEAIDILCGGFPCQDISNAGLQRGIYDGKKSSLWWEMHRIIGILEPRIIIMENVSAITSVGGPDVIGSLAQIGYDCQWSIISAAQCGAPHRRRRWFGIAYPNSQRSRQTRFRGTSQNDCSRKKVQQGRPSISSNTHSTSSQRRWIPSRTQQKDTDTSCSSGSTSFWRESKIPKPTICGMDDGIPTRLDRTTRRNNRHRLKALGNAIVPQCSEWIGQQLVHSGLIDDLMGV